MIMLEKLLAENPSMNESANVGAEVRHVEVHPDMVRIEPDAARARTTRETEAGADIDSHR